MHAVRLLGAAFAALAPAQTPDLSRLPGDLTVPPTQGLAAAGDRRELPAPGDGDARGMASCRGHLWLLRGAQLHRIDARTGRSLDAVPAAAYVGLAADERFVYGVGGDGALHLIDPLAGREVRALRRPDGLPATIAGAAIAAGRTLLADRSGRFHELDADRRHAQPDWRLNPCHGLTWLGTDGGCVVVGKPGLLQWYAADSGERMRVLSAPAGFQAGCGHGGEFWFLWSDRDGTRFCVLQPYPELVQHTVSMLGPGGPGIGAPGAAANEPLHWLIDGLRVDRAAELAPWLRHVAAKKQVARTVDGTWVPRPFVLEVGPGVTVADVRATLAAAAAAGIELRCPGLAAYAARAQADCGRR